MEWAALVVELGSHLAETRSQAVCNECFGREVNNGMAARCFSFGPFELIPDRQVLLRRGTPVRLGIRALDILSVLAERPGEIITKEELISLVWRDTFVDESNLKVNIAAIRKALSEDGSYASCIATVIGRGYRFVAPIQSKELNSKEGSAARPRAFSSCSMSLIQRDKVVQQIAAEIETHPLVTIAGSAGIGKTSVALALSESLAAKYEDGLCFVDFSVIDNRKSIAHAIAGALDLDDATEWTTKRLMPHLANKEMTLVLDTCECVIDAVAGFVELAGTCCPGLHILITSREILRVNGERVCRLPGLDVPPRNSSLTSAELQSYGATQLFLERVTDTVGEYKITEAQAAKITDVCRELDGVPLAIELAARRIQALGFSGLSMFVSEQLLSFYHGTRTGPPRHQSLAAALDWSFDLLSEKERYMLSMLSRFANTFDLDAAIAAVSNQFPNRGEATTCFAGLVSKSLVERLENETGQFRLLNLVRYYASQKLILGGPCNEPGENLHDVARREPPREEYGPRFAKARSAGVSTTEGNSWLPRTGRRKLVRISTLCPRTASSQ